MVEGLNRFNRKAFSKTDTELKVIAAAAIIGFNNGPPNRYRIPIANGIPATLYANAQKRFCLIF